jgi:RLL motif-containing protein 1
MEVPKYKLQALNYPRAASMRIDDEQEVINLVLFLENRHIRQLDVAERKPLDGKPGESWHAAFSEYLEATGCPLLGVSGYLKSRVPEFLHWLVGHAASVTYEDASEALNREAGEALAEAAGGGAGGGASGGAALSVEVPPDAAAIVAQLAELCRVNAAGRTPFEVLQAVGRFVRQRLLPGVAACDAEAAAAEGDGMMVSCGSDGSGGGGGGAGGGGAGGAKTAAALALAATTATSSLAAFAGKALPPAGSRRGRRVVPPPLDVCGMPGGGSGGGRPAPVLDPRSFPLGFETGDATVDTAAALLRMLYVADLRELQDAVNDILIRVQEFTADPRTDSSLGKVGR